MVYRAALTRLLRWIIGFGRIICVQLGQLNLCQFLLFAISSTDRHILPTMPLHGLPTSIGTGTVSYG